MPLSWKLVTINVTSIRIRLNVRKLREVKNITYLKMRTKKTVSVSANGPMQKMLVVQNMLNSKRMLNILSKARQRSKSVGVKKFLVHRLALSRIQK